MEPTGRLEEIERDGGVAVLGPRSLLEGDVAHAEQRQLPRVHDVVVDDVVVIASSRRESRSQVAREALQPARHCGDGHDDESRESVSGDTLEASHPELEDPAEVKVATHPRTASHSLNRSIAAVTWQLRSL